MKLKLVTFSPLFMFCARYITHYWVSQSVFDGFTLLGLKRLLYECGRAEWELPGKKGGWSLWWRAFIGAPSGMAGRTNLTWPNSGFASFSFLSTGSCCCCCCCHICKIHIFSPSFSLSGVHFTLLSSNFFRNRLFPFLLSQQVQKLTWPHPHLKHLSKAPILLQPWKMFLGRANCVQAFPADLRIRVDRDRGGHEVCLQLATVRSSHFLRLFQR